jgi:hypothetical protein
VFYIDSFVELSLNFCGAASEMSFAHVIWDPCLPRHRNEEGGMQRYTKAKEKVVSNAILCDGAGRARRNWALAVGEAPRLAA